TAMNETANCDSEGVEQNYYYKVSFSLGSKKKGKVFIGGAICRGDFSRSGASLEMTDNYRSGSEVVFSACFVMIFAINGKNPAKTPTLL
ncbi:MAG: hypothetical protein GX793_02230, partial [Bacteroidales bacterium]|nr:hypothetical protein [Bacteroidales bacterium]